MQLRLTVDVGRELDAPAAAVASRRYVVQLHGNGLATTAYPAGPSVCCAAQIVALEPALRVLSNLGAMQQRELCSQ